MQEILKILMLEDNSSDAKLNALHLKKEKINFEYLVVETKADFITSLREYNPDIILSDFSLMQFTGLDALEIVQENYTDIPFIMVTGSLDEETAVDCMKQGAWDYVIKDHIVRLGPAVKNAAQRRNDVLQKQEAQRALQESERKFRDLSNLMPEVLCETDLEGNLTYVNEKAFQVFGYKPSDLEQGINIFSLIVSEDRQRAIENVRKLFSGIVSGSDEYTVIRKDLSTFPAIIHANVVFRDGYPKGMRAVLVDITDRKEAEHELIKSLNEKEILLKEVHHRVKNNMQIISSMLKLQMRHIKNKEAQIHLLDSHHRVRTMAMIHEKLYQTEDFEEINFGDYISGLAAYIFSSYQVDTRRIDLVIDVDNIMLNINTAIPCGLIINELITNTLKHAFPNKESGKLELSIKKIKSGKFILKVQDDGIGISEGLDLEKHESLGLQLISALTKQLDGAGKFTTAKGTCFTLIFKQK
jgi:PAS domain S-box-containing protein